jgi:hypothetical protein
VELERRAEYVREAIEDGYSPTSEDLELLLYVEDLEQEYSWYRQHLDQHPCGLEDADRTPHH